MKFRRCAAIEPRMQAIGIVPLVNILFLLLIFLALTPVITSPAKIDVKFPKAMTSDVIQEGDIVIVVSGENVIYMNNKIIAIKDLQAYMARLKRKQVSILIKADRRASVGRIIDVWNVCRALGLERVNIATNQEQ